MKINKMSFLPGMLLVVSLALAACGDTPTSPAPAAAPTTAPAAMTTAMAMTTNAAMTTAAAMTSMAAMTTPAATTSMAAMTMTPGTTMAAMTTPAATTAAASSGKVMMINIGDFKFATDTLTVPAGTKVIWTNKDSTGHTVTSDNADGPLKSSLIDQGKTYEYTFDKAGTYEYHCEPHPFMKGKIIVTA